MSLGHGLSFATERIVDPVQGMHRAIARPWFTLLAPLANPVRVATELISGTVYGSVRVGAAAVGAALDAGLGPDHPLDAPTQAFINGVWGDDLRPHEQRLSTSMGIRNQFGEEVDPHALSTAFPDPANRVVVLVHGLAQTERCWNDTESRQGLVGVLEASPSLTPVTVRYNTGLSIASNGAALASLMEDLVASWPIEVESIGLVGYSMGGLVTRSARAAAMNQGHSWIGLLSDVVTIGAPHTGAPLAQLASAAATALRVAPQTLPLADFLERRSQGIKDLGHGHAAEAQGSDAFGPVDIRDHFIAGVITANPRHPIGVLVGDLMVTRGHDTEAHFEPANVKTLGGVHHFGLLHDPTVIDLVADWLNDPDDLEAHRRSPE